MTDDRRERTARNGASRRASAGQTNTTHSEDEHDRRVRRTTRNGRTDGDDGRDAAEVRRLRTENERLREQYNRRHRSRHRRTALGLTLVGLVAGGIAALAPSVRGPLVAVAATGVFAGVLTWYLTPERFVPADVGEAVASPLLRNERAVVDQLNLSDRRTYVRTEDGPRLYVPRTPVDGVPPGTDLDGPFVVTDDAATSGVSFVPCGAELYREFDETAPTDRGDEADAVVDSLCEALVETFELARSADSTVETTEDGVRATVELSEPAYSSSVDFDHPVNSFLAVGIATEFETTVTTETSRLDADRVVLTCRWPSDRTEADAESNDFPETR